MNTDSPRLENVTFAELTLGRSAELKRTLRHDDIALFAAVSGDVNPAHLDPVYAAGDMFRGVIGHGMWTGALISTLLGTQLPGPGTIYLGQELKFLRPVRIGDEITVRISVAELKPEKAIVVFDCTAEDGAGRRVCEGRATVIAPRERISVRRPDMPEAHVQEHDRYHALIARCKPLPALRIGVVHPTQAHVLEAVAAATCEGLIDPVLIGPAEKIRRAAEEADIDISGWPLTDTPHSHAAAETAARMAASGAVAALMKGALHSDELLGAIVALPELRTERRISHAYFLDAPGYHKPLIITDAAVNIAPDLNAKADICRNAISLFRALYGTERLPNIAPIAAVETVNAKMPATLDAAALTVMAARGQITGAVIDGPLALDAAISPEAVRIKGIRSPTAGDADVLLVPNIEAGNLAAKALSLLGQADSAGIVLGARVPTVFSSRSENTRTRLMSCALAVLLQADS